MSDMPCFVGIDVAKALRFFKSPTSEKHLPAKNTPYPPSKFQLFTRTCYAFSHDFLCHLSSVRKLPGKIHAFDL